MPLSWSHPLARCGCFGDRDGSHQAEYPGQIFFKYIYVLLFRTFKLNCQKYGPLSTCFRDISALIPGIIEWWADHVILIVITDSPPWGRPPRHAHFPKCRRNSFTICHVLIWCEIGFAISIHIPALICRFLSLEADWVRTDKSHSIFLSPRSILLPYLSNKQKNWQTID
jgi:hypothetical protein